MQKFFKKKKQFKQKYTLKTQQETPMETPQQETPMETPQQETPQQETPQQETPQQETPHPKTPKVPTLEVKKDTPTKDVSLGRMIENKKKEILDLERNIKSTENTILNDDEDHEESSWRLMKLALEEQLGVKKGELEEMERKNIDRFMRNASSGRRQGDANNRRIFAIAKKDAEERMFSIVALSDYEIAQCFSTENFFIRCDLGPVRPPKFVYSWYHDLSKKENNIIPLSHGIEIPKKRNQVTGEVRDVNFLVSYFYGNTMFLERCQSYYRTFGLSLSIRKDKKFNRRWWIKLKVDNEENKILFKQLYNFQLDEKIP